LTVPHPDPKPLEPWALELLRQERGAGDASDAQELARLVALLRALPEPERSPDLTRRILERVAVYEARPRVVHVLFDAADQLRRPGVAAMMAAGIAALFAIGVAPESIPSVLRTDADGAVVASTGNDASYKVASANASPRRSRVVVRPQFVSAAFAQAPAAAPRIHTEWAPIDAIDARLDQQLNQLQMNPTAFAERLERVAQRDQFISRLATRAAQRGDAPEIALRVRESDHPLANQLMESLLHATLVVDVEPH
jgi:hypothetical protein